MKSLCGLAAGPAPTDKAGWQEEWGYMKEGKFQGLMNVALESPYNRALRPANS